MVVPSNYSDFFEIDENFFPVVNEELINGGQVDWRNFYPHETFVKLIETTLSVLERNQKKSIWVEGAYGTGKSYSALTVKKILDEPVDDVREYFEKMGLPKDLLKRVEAAKNNRILTIHKYGSSFLNSDLDLITTIQESINQALIKSDMEPHNDTIRENIIDWMSKPRNKKYFDGLLSEENNSTKIGYESSDDIISKLKLPEYTTTMLLVQKIIALSKENNIDIAKVNTIDKLLRWITLVIEENNLDSILFVWDEFTEFFKNNKNTLSGFQHVAELSEHEPFYFMIVTHKSESFFQSNEDGKLIFDRFVTPRCQIKLPDNMAFALIAKALEKKNSNLESDWHNIVSSFSSKLLDSSDSVIKFSSIKQSDLNAILPITPYAALMLKYLSSTFRSNQRSMFEFIKDSNNEDVEGFQWFINNTSALSEWPLLTVDLLWNYFYDNGKDGMEPDIRMILDYFDIGREKIEYDSNLCRIFKAILLLQAMSNRTGNKVQLFRPTVNNLKLVFDGTPLMYKVKQLADMLVNKQLLICVPSEKGVDEYNVGINSGDYQDVERIIVEKTASITTKEILHETPIIKVLFDMNGIYSRINTILTTSDRLKEDMVRSRNKDHDENKIDAFVVLSSREDEASSVSSMIKNLDLSQLGKSIIIDASATFFGIENIKTFVRSRELENYHQNKDSKKQKSFSEEKEKVLQNWKDSLDRGRFLLYSGGYEPTDCHTLVGLQSELLTYVEKQYKLGLELFNVKRSDYYKISNVKQAALCAIKREISGKFKSSKRELENALEGAWDDESYWTNEGKQDLLITKIKNKVEEYVQKSFEVDKTVSIASIYDYLYEMPFGFLDSDLSAFFIAFLLSDYASEKYAISNGQITPSDPIDALAEAIKQTYNERNTSKYSEWYISPVSDTLSNFYKVSAQIFKFDPVSNIDDCVDNIRAIMRNFGFPLWSLKYSKYEEVRKEKIIQIIDGYVSIVNTEVHEKTKIAEQIGLLCKESGVSPILKKLFTKEQCGNAMKSYVHTYQNGELENLADGLNIHYMDILSGKNTTDSAWLWNEDVTKRNINETIDEFKILRFIADFINPSIYDIMSAKKNLKSRLTSVKIPLDFIGSKYPEYKGVLLSAYDYSSRLVDQTIIAELAESIDVMKNAFELLSNNVELFRKIDTRLGNYSDEQIRDIISSISYSDCNTITKESYIEIIDKIIADQSRSKKKSELMEYWRNNTHTLDPRDWSEKHLTPIICVFSEDIDKIRKVLFTVSGTIYTLESIEEALLYLKESNMIYLLNDKDYVDSRFRECVLKQYSSMFDDLSEIRNKLYSKVINVEDWVNAPAIKYLAKEKYALSSKAEALSLIDSIPLDDLKQYLRDQVENNMNLGIELLRKYE